MEILINLFGSDARVKILRLFLFNPTETFDIDDVARRAEVRPAIVRKEIAMLARINFIRRKHIKKVVIKKHGRQTLMVRKRVTGWTRDNQFPYMRALEDFLGSLAPLNLKGILRRIMGTGKIKLVLTAGVFIGNRDSRLDILIVGDSIKKGRLERVIKTIEAEIGRELRYAVFTTSDFQYRLGMYDKLIRDVLDYPHNSLIDRLHVAPQEALA